ncbi:MAG: hypothetical protein V9E82_12435 [Candidatus Nanopelagicales bacterium]
MGQIGGCHQLQPVHRLVPVGAAGSQGELDIAERGHAREQPWLLRQQRQPALVRREPRLLIEQDAGVDRSAAAVRP